MSARTSISIVVLSWAVAPAVAADPKPLVEEIVKPFLEKNPHTALAVGVVTPEGQFTYFFGTVKLGDKEQPPDGSTIFSLGSLTKAYTGVLLADLVRDGKVKLDDPVQKHLPDDIVLPKRGDKPITMLDLTTHYSGLPVQPPELGLRNFKLTPPKAWRNPYSHYDRARLIKELAEIELERDPGSKFDYSNLGAGLLGHALARAAGTQSFDEALTQRIGNPLGLKDTVVRLNDSQRARLAPGHGKDGKPADHWEFAMLESCGGLFSTLTDQLKFIQANLGLIDTPLATTLADSHKARRDTERPPERIGLGWIVRPFGSDPGQSMVWHNGGTFAAHSFLGFVPERKIGVVMLNNSDNSTDRLAIDLLKKLAGD